MYSSSLPDLLTVLYSFTKPLRNISFAWILILGLIQGLKVSAYSTVDATCQRQKRVDNVIWKANKYVIQDDVFK